MRRHAFRLARQAGRLDVDKLMSEIPAPLFTEWLAFEILEPTDGTRISEYLLQLTLYVVSFLTGRVEEYEDFHIEFGKDFAREFNAEEVEIKLKSALASMTSRFPGAIQKVPVEGE